MSIMSDIAEDDLCVACAQLGERTEATRRIDDVGAPICEECHAEQEAEKARQAAHALEQIDWSVLDVDTQDAAAMTTRLANAEPKEGSL